MGTRTKNDYHDIVREHAMEGWRLLQVLTPVTGTSYYELIFEKEKQVKNYG
ncbi:MAG: DUF4177 domain-containing protein [Clostridiaceae bacterium]|nr:DUF4177 domain-containing protein [Clostridiaceae bacterium]